MTLDNEGFTLLSKPSTVANFYDDSEVESRYFDEIRTLLTQELGKVSRWEPTQFCRAPKEFKIP